jgi:UDP-N-acetylmuramoylalanine--D-glutamate ligase
VSGLRGGGRRAAVVGLGLSGSAAARLLSARGWEVVAVDSSERSAPDLVARGIEVRAPWSGAVESVDLVVKSPGVPGEAAPIAAARDAGVPVWSEIELASRAMENPLLAITGTNGKTTTTELTAHLLRVGGVEARACGNQGTPVSGLADEVGADEWLVVEASSFQLEDIERFHPRGAALLNVAPDHLDRHGDLAAYVAAKLRIFENMTSGDLAIAPTGIDARTAGAAIRRVGPGPGGSDLAAWDADGALYVAGRGAICSWETAALRGEHNRQNMMVAAALAAHAGVSAAQLGEGLASFPGVRHRLEERGTSGGVLYVNDSKATNPAAAIAALEAYGPGVRLIAGGRAKGTAFDELARAARGSVLKAYLIGEAAGELARAFADRGIPVERCGELQAAVAAAAGESLAGEIVLLAPACASFDQFASFEERGDAFCREAARYGADGGGGR